MGEIKKDCFAIERIKNSKTQEVCLRCSALSEFLCASKGKCGFYMSRQDKLNRDKLLREKGYNV